MSALDSSGVTSKSKEGIPSWNGSAESFQAYQEAALLFEQTTPYQKRYLCGPKLQSALEGAALRLVIGKRPDWLSDNNGVNRLLEHLRRGLGRPQMPELTDLLSRYFRSTRRRSNESMNEYVTRKAEVYVRAQQAMKRVQPVHGMSSASQSLGSGWPTPPGGEGFPPRSRRGSNASWTSSGAMGSVASPEEGSETGENAPPTTSGQGSEGATTREENWNGRWYGGWSDSSWSYGNWDWWSSPSWQRSDWSSWEYPSVQESYPELVPEFVQAWLLLTDAGLEASERNLILTAIQGDLTLARVAQELRNHFPESELRKKEPGRKHQGYLGEQEMEGLETETEAVDFEAGFHAEDELTEEGWALWSAATQESQEAMAALQTARRTLKGARERQKLVKLSRQYYKVSNSSSRNTENRKDDKITCLRCGQTGHRAANCPAPQPKDSGKSSEMAPFVCYTDGVGESFALQACAEESGSLTTAEAVAAGKAIIDCGATKSLGSVHALEQVMRLSSNGKSAVDVSNRPVFGFGNSSEDRCVSTVHLKIRADGRPGLLQVHALDKGTAPILLSVSSLKALGVIIDFSEGSMVLRHVNPHQLLSLEESRAGHFLLPLVGDLLEKAVTTRRPIPKLSSFAGDPAESSGSPE